MTAVDALTAALGAALESGTPPPCTGHVEWLSDDADERREAAGLCAGSRAVARRPCAIPRPRRPMGNAAEPP